MLCPRKWAWGALVSWSTNRRRAGTSWWSEKSDVGDGGGGVSGGGWRWRERWFRGMLNELSSRGGERICRRAATPLRRDFCGVNSARNREVHGTPFPRGCQSSTSGRGRPAGRACRSGRCLVCEIVRRLGYDEMRFGSQGTAVKSSRRHTQIGGSKFTVRTSHPSAPPSTHPSPAPPGSPPAKPPG